MAELPRGSITFLFTDVEGSTRLVQQLGESYGAVLGELRRVLRAATKRSGGVEVECRADEFFATFQRASDAVAAAVEAQRELGVLSWPKQARVRVRMGLHTGEPAVEGEHIGVDVIRAARVCSAAHGGQILLSQATRELVVGETTVKELGSFALAGLSEPERLFQVVAAGLETEFPPPSPPARNPRHSVVRRFSAPIWRRRRRASLQESAFRVRARLPDAPSEVRRALSELSAALFTADRATKGAAAFLVRVDRKRLERRLADRRSYGVASRRAREQADALADAIAAVEAVGDRQADLAGLADQLPQRLEALETARAVYELAARVQTVISELDAAMLVAATRLDPLSFKLHRTRHRGVYRSGRLYVVPYVDELGAEKRREFATIREASDFRLGKRIVDSATTVFAPTWGASGSSGENMGSRGE